MNEVDFVRRQEVGIKMAQKVYNVDSLVYNNENDRVVYNNTKNNDVKEEEEDEDNDGSYSGVTFLGCSLSEQGNPSLSMKVIDVLGKPYDEEEYDGLWQDVKRRKPKERHLELRNGRERLCSLKKEGKSYLDHHPGLEKKLMQAQDDKPKCLNLLRGFFFWLKLPGPFCPWEDAECLAMNSETS